MKFSIGKRLFFAMLFSAMVVATIGVELARWKLFDPFPHHSADIEIGHQHDLINTLATQYAQHHDWSFIPADPAERKTWLRAAFARSQRKFDARDDAELLSSNLGYRIGLLDRNEKYLAGAIAHPAMVAFASIDTIRMPITVDGETVGYLVIAKPDNPDDELAIAFLIDQQNNLFVVAIISVALSGLAAALLAANFRKPIKQLVEGARRLENAQFNTRLNIRRYDEIGELAQTFNHLAAKLEDTERSRQQWVADTSHELRTPLSVLRGQLEALQDGIRTASPENVALMLRQILSLTKLVDELYELARADVGQLHYDKVDNDVWRLIQDVFESFAEKFRSAGLTATIAASPVYVVVYCDVDRIRQVVTNLLENSVRYTAAGGRIDVNGSVVGTELRIAIDDSAPGVPEHSLDRLGERFFRIESSRNRQLGGTGLGLALSRQILEAHSGRLEFGASPLGGLRATIVLNVEISG